MVVRSIITPGHASKKGTTSRDLTLQNSGRLNSPTTSVSFRTFATRYVTEKDASRDFTSQISANLTSPTATWTFGEIYRCAVRSSAGEEEFVLVKVFKIEPGRAYRDKLTRAMLEKHRVWLKLKHSNIVPLLGTARVGTPLLAYVYPWMSSTLNELLEKQATALPTSARIKLVEGIAESLRYLHSENMIHGDLHPRNVFIDDSGNPCLTGFGIATVMEDLELHRTATAVGCNFDARWRAPEVIGIGGDPGKSTFGSDIYSFGSVMFFIISGDIPWKDEDSDQISNELITRAPPRHLKVRDSHWDLIRMCWSWEPRCRPEATKVLQILAEHRQETSSSSGTLRSTSVARRPGTDRRNTTTKVPQRSIKNIVIFGETGAGKSSVINLMAGQSMAKTSPDMERCTLHWQEHNMTFEQHSFKIFDTIGLEEPQLGMKEYLDVIVNAHNLVAKLDNEGGIDLLIFCVRAGRVTATLQTNYRLFYEWLCEKKVPIVLVLTGLERENNMEDWWVRNQFVFQRYGIEVAGHACITAATKMDGRHQQLYEQSRTLVRELVIKHTDDKERVAYRGGEGWYREIIQKLWGLTLGRVKFAPKRKNIENVLTKRCGMPPVAAKELATKIRTDLGEKSSRR